MWTHQILNLPPIPQQFVDLALAADPTLLGEKTKSTHYKKGKDPYAIRDLTRNGESVANIRVPRYYVNEEFEQWVKENIVKDFTEASISISSTYAGSLGAHSDRKRDYGLLYVVRQGGPDVRTVFYQQKGHSVIRNRYVSIDDYDQLDIIDVADLGVNRWVLLDARILHSVENVVDQRISFQISIDRDLSELSNRTMVLPPNQVEVDPV